jgi:hypothetical protein
MPLPSEARHVLSYLVFPVLIWGSRVEDRLGYGEIEGYKAPKISAGE